MNSEIMNGRLMGKAAAVVCRQQPLSQFLGILKPALVTTAWFPGCQPLTMATELKKEAKGPSDHPTARKVPLKEQSVSWEERRIFKEMP